MRWPRLFRGRCTEAVAMGYRFTSSGLSWGYSHLLRTHALKRRGSELLVFNLVEQECPVNVRTLEGSIPSKGSKI